MHAVRSATESDSFVSFVMSCSGEARYLHTHVILYLPHQLQKKSDWLWWHVYMVPLWSQSLPSWPMHVCIHVVADRTQYKDRWQNKQKNKQKATKITTSSASSTYCSAYSEGRINLGLSYWCRSCMVFHPLERKLLHLYFPWFFSDCVPFVAIQWWGYTRAFGAHGYLPAHFGMHIPTLAR